MFNVYNYISIMFGPAFSPGLNSFLSMSNTVNVGFKKGLKFNLGIFAGTFILSYIVAIFAKVFADHMPSIINVMKYVGFIYMMRLAFKSFRASHDMNVKPTSGSFMAGLILQFMNPSALVFGFIMITTQLLPYFSDPIEMFPYIVIRALLIFSESLLWSLFGSIFRSFFERHTKIINIVLAFLIIYSAFAILLT